MAERRRDKVREAYQSMGIDRQELARRTGINPSTITNVIAGNPLSRAAAARIGQVIGWTADEVLAGERRDDDQDGGSSVEGAGADEAQAQADAEAAPVAAAPKTADVLIRGLA